MTSACQSRRPAVVGGTSCSGAAPAKGRSSARCRPRLRGMRLRYSSATSFAGRCNALALSPVSAGLSSLWGKKYATVPPAVPRRSWNDKSPAYTGLLAVQLWGACSNPEVVVELRRLAEVAAAVMFEHTDQRPTSPPSPPPRPGWVFELVVAVLTSTDESLRPQDIIRRAEQIHGHRLAPSSIRNALRVGAKHDHGPIERVRYGTYRLRRSAPQPKDAGPADNDS